MAIFPKNSTDRVPTRTDTPVGDNGLSIIAPGMKVTGDVETPGIIKIEGVIEGSVRGARQVLVGRQGTVHGDIRAAEIVLGGTVEGTIFATDRVEIEGTSSIHGDIHTKSIIVHEGGRINGSVRMGEALEHGAADTETPRVGLAISS
jgi:cytoskeletal protein CcmA (bactofilin family)